MTDWVSAGGMILSGLIVGFMFWYGMKGRASKPDLERRDLEAKRDALLAQLRELKEMGGSEEEQRRLERETADVLRKIDAHASAKRRSDSPVRPAADESRTGESDLRSSAATVDIAAATRAASIRGFVWGALSVAILGGIAWFVTEKATPRTDSMTGGTPMTSTAPQSAAQQQPDPALQQIQAAVEKSPDNLELRSELAKAFLERENLMGVFEQTSYILKRSPNDAKALTYQALVRVSMGQSAGAVEMLQRAIKSDPDLTDAYVALAWADMQSGKTSEAEGLIAEAGRRHPDQKIKLDEVLVRMKEQMRNAPPAAMPANHPALPNPDGSQSAGTPMAAAPATAAGGPTLHVTLTLDPSAKSSPNAVLYVIARAAGQTAGPPAAVKRIMAPAFPLEIDLSTADSMMGQPLPANVRLEARLDSDGDAMTKNPSDPHAMQDGVATNGGKVGLVLK
ncbi:MAG: cytochrome c-type biosis protein CcmH [Thermoanaerobaculia bacterium]|jgi:tetratricopeptide (TPR) repeat protein|nr:cytochrome c-type biosis protein CcmH [Thermoanaerobaculia bacterium]